ncbi:carboxylesterase/lipase family protein [Pelagibacterium sp.]|uniref:carboxylesterase/lipase family protein n=1 Tax=Pelagibacterium sp. TaxID=1967288 RepID=UPI003A9204D2
MFRLNKLAATAVAVVTLALTASAQGQIVKTPIPGDPVQTSSGQIAGKILDSGVKAYFGVPFAEPPLRDLRWQPPQPHTAWDGVYNADRFAPECMQSLRNSDINHYFGEESLSEDCLYLNIWAPEDANEGDDLPVVVWIYGGGFNVGSTNMANYSGEQLAQRGVIYVAISYRLGAMGFMAHPQLAAESDTETSGNYGLMDQAFALQWLQDNIAAFGGDATNVTIVGQSAGSMSLSALQVSPLAEGAFHKIFGMSGSVVNSFASPYEQVEAAGLRAQEQLGATSIEQMHAISADKFLDLEGVRFGIGIDGYVLPEPAWTAFENGNFADVPMVIGYTRDETFNGLASAQDAEALRSRAQEMFGDDAEDILALYDLDAENFRRTAVDISRDTSMASAVRDWAIAQTTYGDSPVYAYIYSRTQPYTQGVEFADHDPDTVGAYHTVEVPYFLDTLDSLNIFRQTRTWTDADLKLRDQSAGALVAFAQTGDPSLDGLDWPTYALDDERIVKFDIGTIETIDWPNHEAMQIVHEQRLNQ